MRAAPLARARPATLDAAAGAGYKVSADDFGKALKLYYEMMNWDEEGVPREAKLGELDLGWVNALLRR